MTHQREPGTRACYGAGCRAPECLAAHLRYNKQRLYLNATGRPRRVDPAEARARIRELHRQGFSLYAIGMGAGIARTQVANVLNTRGRINIATHVAVLSTTREKILHTYPGALIEPTITARQVRALARLGHRVDWIAEQLGMGRKSVISLRAGNNPVKAGTALAVHQLVTEVGDTPGPSHLAAKRAEDAGWPPPAEYDEQWRLPRERPDYEPAPSELQEMRERRLPRVKQLTECGYSAAQIGEMLVSERLLRSDSDPKSRQRMVVRDRASLGISAPTESASAA